MLLKAVDPLALAHSPPPHIVLVDFGISEMCQERSQVGQWKVASFMRVANVQKSAFVVVPFSELFFNVLVPRPRDPHSQLRAAISLQQELRNKFE